MAPNAQRQACSFHRLHALREPRRFPASRPEPQHAEFSTFSLYAQAALWYGWARLQIRTCPPNRNRLTHAGPPGPTGRTKPAQGNALGTPTRNGSALKGRSISSRRRCRAPSGLDLSAIVTEGVALGWPVPALRAC